MRTIKIPKNFTQVAIKCGSAIGWKKEEMLLLLSDSFCKNMVILGGDVMRMNSQNKCYEYTYDSWHAERYGPLEDFLEFCKRSREIAINYISKYDASDDHVFVPIISAELTAGL